MERNLPFMSVIAISQTHAMVLATEALTSNQQSHHVP